MSSALIKHVKLKIEQSQDAMIRENGKGGAADWVGYHRRVGIIQGHETALKIINDAEQQLRDQGDLDGDD